MYVEGVDDTLKQGLHFSQVTQGVTSDAGDFLGLSASDVAKGIAAAVNGDATGRFNATVPGSTVTVTGPAFLASISGAGTQGALTGTKGAFDGDTTLTLTGTPTVGEVWKVTINGADFGYGVQAADLTATGSARGDRDPARVHHQPRRPLPRDRLGRSDHGHAAGRHVRTR